MIERIIHIDNVDPINFYGVNNSNIHLLRSLFPKLRINARGQIIKALGDEADTAEFEEKVKLVEEYCARYNKLTDDVIIDIVKGEQPKELNMKGVIIYGVNGKPISARTKNQIRFVEQFNNNDLTIALGPAGTGKTYVAIALAVRALKNRQVRKIILS
ncbi:MAG: PhoH family protein, partial [Muribaculaceae bacterium]|nr:PhoH family protein [Muribaculaceae bacterium]